MSCVLANAREWSLGRASRLTILQFDLQARTRRAQERQRRIAHLKGLSADKSTVVLTDEDFHAV